MESLDLEKIRSDADNAILQWYPQEAEKAREPLRLACAIYYKRALGPYATLLYHDIFLLEKWYVDQDLYDMVDLFLMGAAQEEEVALCNVLLYADKTKEQLTDAVRSIPFPSLWKWIRGEFQKQYPAVIDALIRCYVEKMKAYDKKRIVNRKRFQIEHLSTELSEEVYMNQVRQIVKRYKEEEREHAKEVMMKQASIRRGEIKQYVLNRLVAIMSPLKNDETQLEKVAKDFSTTDAYFQHEFESILKEYACPSSYITDLYPSVSKEQVCEYKIDSLEEHQLITHYDVLHNLYYCNECIVIDSDISAVLEECFPDMIQSVHDQIMGTKKQ